MKPAAARRTGAEARRIATALREDIIRGVFKSGEALRQERLADMYQASRMPVRDALRGLETQGLVEISPNRGAIVARLDPLEFRELYEMRGALEVLALRLTIPELTNSQLDMIEEIQDEAERSGLRDFGALNKAFHMGLYEPCGRPRLLAQIATLNDMADRYLRVAAIELDYTRRSHREHRALLKACRRRDEASATGCLQDHIAAAGEALFQVLSERLS